MRRFAGDSEIRLRPRTKIVCLSNELVAFVWQGFDSKDGFNMKTGSRFSPKNGDTVVSTCYPMTNPER